MAFYGSEIQLQLVSLFFFCFVFSDLSWIKTSFPTFKKRKSCSLLVPIGRFHSCTVFYFNQVRVSLVSFLFCCCCCCCDVGLFMIFRGKCRESLSIDAAAGFQSTCWGACDLFFVSLLCCIYSFLLRFVFVLMCIFFFEEYSTIYGTFWWIQSREKVAVFHSIGWLNRKRISGRIDRNSLKQLVINELCFAVLNRRCVGEGLYGMAWIRNECWMQCYQHNWSNQFESASVLTISMI